MMSDPGVRRGVYGGLVVSLVLGGVIVLIGVLFAGYSNDNGDSGELLGLLVLLAVVLAAIGAHTAARSPRAGRSGAGGRPGRVDHLCGDLCSVLRGARRIRFRPVVRPKRLALETCLHQFRDSRSVMGA